MRTALLFLLLAATAACGQAEVPGAEPPAATPLARGPELITSDRVAPDSRSAEWKRPDWRPVLAAVVARAGPPAAVTETATDRQRLLIARAAELKRLSSLRPDDDQLRVARAQVYAEASFPGRALAVLGQILEGSPDNIDALLLAARCLAAERDRAGFSALLERVAELDGVNLESRRLLAGQHLEAGREREARARAGEVLARVPFDPAMHLVLGRLDADSEQWLAAEEHLRTAATGDAHSLAAHYLWARALRALDRTADAERVGAAHARLVRLDDLGLPEEWPARRRRLALARSYRETGDAQLAEVELRALLAAPEPAAAALAEWRALLSAAGRNPERELLRDFSHLASK